MEKAQVSGKSLINALHSHVLSVLGLLQLLGLAADNNNACEAGCGARNRISLTVVRSSSSSSSSCSSFRHRLGQYIIESA